MNCPQCNVALDQRKYRGLEVDHCSECRGLWLDFEEMDLLEDTANREEILKGTRDYARRAGDRPCPHCGAKMDVFNYRAYNLPIEHCPNDHGYWLDKGEEERLLELMKERARDLRRSETAEQQWQRFMERGVGAAVSWTASKICSGRFGGVSFQRWRNEGASANH